MQSSLPVSYLDSNSALGGGGGTNFSSTFGTESRLGEASGFGSSSNSFESSGYGGMDGLSSSLLGGNHSFPAPASMMQNQNQNQQTSPRPLGFNAPLPPASFHPGPGGNAGDRVLDNDALPDSVFPELSWLRSFGMCMYRWTSDSTEVALHVHGDLLVPLIGQNGAGLGDLYRRTNCQVKVDRQFLQGSRENFLVFHRGQNGHPANQHMSMALQMVGERLRFILRKIPVHSSTGTPTPPVETSSRLNLGK